MAGLNALVATLFNPLRGQGVSDRWPSIVQDVLVLAGPMIFVLFKFSEQLLALGVAGSVVIGIALKDTLGNLFAGLALQVKNRFMSVTGWFWEIRKGRFRKRPGVPPKFAPRPATL